MKKTLSIVITLLMLMITFNLTGCSNSFGESYTITVAEMENGIIRVSKETAKQNAKITVNIIPNVGYQLKDNTFYINDSAHSGDSFKMPNENVIKQLNLN